MAPEPVPFAFIAEADRYQSNVTPPRPERRSAKAVCGGVLITVVLIAGLLAAVALGMPALRPPTA
ncbi:hypothetical protein F4556_000292 [Kitasatospora gansuensis]|uniref:Uncharacterized protein n=1 Tax=Kitasatospora gansuensis TaxID=258050 RepID=A0A7W7WEG8_9ACTN|nr:hypothetical protein [Kitasatospora gansuensis]MBB4944757.1 hypothetical protein [Kitasatospora gansuensis]